MEFNVQLEKGIDDMDMVGLQVNVSDLKVGVVKSYNTETGIAIVEITYTETIQKIMHPPYDVECNIKSKPSC